MIDLNDLHVFAHLSRAQSFTLAARRLGMPKSTVSRSLSRLEARLGVRLVERTTRKVMLTEAGELYFDRCQRMLEEAEEAERLMGALHATPRGRLRVGAPIAFAQYVLGPMLGEFLNRYPELSISVQCLNLLPARGERGLDVVIRAGPLEDSGLLQRPLMKLRLGAYASPQYLQAKGAPATPAALRQHSCISTSCHEDREPADSVTWHLRHRSSRGEAAEAVRIPSRVSVTDPSITYQLALAGVGIALLSQCAAEAEVEAGRLVRVLPEWEPDEVELHAVYASRLQSSPKVRAFVLFLQQRLQESRVRPASRNPDRMPLGIEPALPWRQLGGALSAGGRTLPAIEARTPSDQRERPGQKVASHMVSRTRPSSRRAAAVQG